jgi:hypothetical protein
MPDSTSAHESARMRFSGGTTAKIKKLNTAVEKRLRFEGERQAVVRGLSAAHANFLIAIEPLIDDSVFNLVARGDDAIVETIKAITDLAFFVNASAISCDACVRCRLWSMLANSMIDIILTLFLPLSQPGAQ